MKKETIQTIVFVTAFFGAIAAVAAVLILTGALNGGAWLF